jgi:(S)-sulfolactate dehydrogenase
MPDVLVAEDVWGPPFVQLAQALDVRYEPELWRDRRALLAAAGGCRALVVRNRIRVDGELLDAAPGLRVVARAGAGLDNVDVAGADRRGVVVLAAPGANAGSVAEHTLGLALALARGIVGHDRAVRAGRWDRVLGTELSGRTWGLLGVGATGLAVARLAGCLGMRVLGYDTAVGPDDPRLAGVPVRLVPLAEVAAADVVSIHLPATPDTHHLVDGEFLARMRPGALLVSAGRGEVVDEAALARALDGGSLGGAALDVRETEPPQPGPLDACDRVVFTPHVAGLTHEAQDRVLTMLADDLAALLAGGTARHAAGAAHRIGPA